MNLSTATDRSIPQTLAQAGASQGQSLLVFHLGERAYGISIEYVVQIIPMLKLTPVPQVEQVVEGIVNIHGKVVPVMNVRRNLGLPSIPPRLYTPIILIQTAKRMMGLIVDEVADVAHVSANQVTSPEAIMPDGYESATVLSGVVYQGDKAIIVLDPRYLLYPSQLRAVSKAIQSMPKPTAAQKAQAEPVILPAEPLTGGNGDMPESDLIAQGQEMKMTLAPKPDQPCPDGGEPKMEAPASSIDISAVSQAVEEQPEKTMEPANESGNGAAPHNGKSKPRRRSRKLEATLAGEIASLSVDLPPSEGEFKASPENTPVSPDPEPPSGE